MNNPLISIIMPMYNTGHLIGNAIRSVINQTYQNWQLIIIDDGSTDNSADIADGYAKENQKISVYHKSNGGLSDARNYGLNYVKGQYIHFFDSDDTIDNNLYSEIIKIQNNQNYDIIIFGYNTISTTQKQCFMPQQGVYPSDNIILQNTIFLNFAWNKIYRTDFIKHYNLLFKKGTYLIEDLIFNSKALPLAGEIYFDNRCFYNYIQYETQTLSNTFKIDNIKLCAEALIYEREKLISLKIDNKIIEKEIGKLALTKIRFLFHLIRKDVNSNPHKIKLFKTILNSSQLTNKIKLSSITNFKDLIIFLCLKLKSSYIISILYKPIQQK